MSQVTDQGRRSTATGVVSGLIVAARPRHWVKNLLVFAAPIAAQAVADAAVMGWAVIAFAAFTSASVGTYLLNDVRDRDADRDHPVKRHRPVASGAVPVAVAQVVAVLAFAAGVGIPAVLGRSGLAAVVAVYVASTTVYSFGAKRLPLFELVIVAAGFVLRAAGGAVAADVPISQWFLIVTSFGALYLVATKRYAELRDRDDSQTRQVLGGYTPDVLREIRFTAAAATIVGYVLWAFENAEAPGAGWWFELSIVPFVLAIYRYAMAVHDGEGEAPEDILLRDPQMLALGGAWVLLYAAGLYVS